MDLALAEKIRKLYRLAKDPANEHEAALAADRVRQLLEQHNLSLGEVLLERSQSIEQRLDFGRRVVRHFAYLANACKLLFDVEWFSWAGIVFCGLPENVQAAILSMHYFRGAINVMLRKRKNIRAGRARHLYRCGAAARIFSEAQDLKFAAMSGQAHSETTALVHVASSVAQDHLKRHNLRPVRKRKPLGQSASFLAGYYDASEIEIAGAQPLIGSRKANRL